VRNSGMQAILHASLTQFLTSLADSHIVAVEYLAVNMGMRLTGMKAQTLPGAFKCHKFIVGSD